MTVLGTITSSTNLSSANLSDGSSLAAVGSAYSSRVLADATEYTPSATRPTLVVVSPLIAADTKNDHGQIALQVGTAGAPSTIATFDVNNITNDGVNTQRIDVGQPFSFIVPANKVYKLVQSNVAGTCAFTLGSAFELTL